MKKDTIKSLTTREQCRDDYFGRKFGRLLCQEIVYKNKYYQKKYRCICECGKETMVYRQKLTSGDTKSCGCIQREVASQLGKSHKKYYEEKHFVSAWQNMKARASNREYSGYTENLGRWEDYHNFKEDMYDDYLKHVKEHGEKDTQLDRIDVNKGYFKENCRWLGRLGQAYNRMDNKIIEYKNMKKNFMEWKIYFNSDLNIDLIKNRVDALNWNIERACTEPINVKFRRKNKERK